MKKELQKVIADTKQWVEQEKSWGGDFFFKAAAAEAASENRRTGGPAKISTTMADTTSGRLNQTTPPVAPTPRRSDTPTRPSSPEKATRLKALHETYATCTRCPLGASRLNFVFGVGSPSAEVMLIGEGPGYDEDHQGEPFIGRSGKLLDKMMEAIGLSRQTIYIANIVKCHPMVNPQTPHERGNDRPPTPEESSTCSPILQQQIEIIRPKVILTLGSPSTKTVLGVQDGISKVRGKLALLPTAFFKKKETGKDLIGKKQDDAFNGFTAEQLEAMAGIQVLPTYHPAALLRNPNLKKDAWEDLKLLRDTLKNSPR